MFRFELSSRKMDSQDIFPATLEGPGGALGWFVHRAQVFDSLEVFHVGFGGWLASYRYSNAHSACRLIPSKRRTGSFIDEEAGANTCI